MKKAFSTSVNKVFLISVVLTLGWMIFMGISVRPFTSKQIVAFELAKTPDAATILLNEWKESGLVTQARKSIYLDFIFLVLYSFSIALGCLVLSNFTNTHFLIVLGSWLSKLMAVAGFSDGVENLAMLRTFSEPTSLTTGVAYWFAMVKFSIVIASLLFVLICLVVGGWKRAWIK